MPGDAPDLWPAVGRDAPAGAATFAAQSWDGACLTPSAEHVAEETPVALVYNGISHAVMLATPTDLEDFATGFTLSEGIVADVREIHDIESTEGPDGIAIDLTIAAERFAGLKERRRNLIGRTGCGLCGTESLDQVLRPLPAVRRGPDVTSAALHRAAHELKRRQPLHAFTGAIHAAGWAQPDGTLVRVREDVGRHNALDKLIGAMARERLPCADGFVLLTSRASSEMVQKAATMGIPLVAAISAPTSLAIRLAEATGVTLVGFLREKRHCVYTHAGRLHASTRESNAL